MKITTYYRSHSNVISYNTTTRRKSIRDVSEITEPLGNILVMDLIEKRVEHFTLLLKREFLIIFGNIFHIEIKILSNKI